MPRRCVHVWQAYQPIDESFQKELDPDDVPDLDGVVLVFSCVWLTSFNRVRLLQGGR